MQYALRVQGPGSAGTTGTYFCRVCSERLGEAHEEDRAAELLGRFGDLDAGLRTKIWTVALGLAPLVRFPVPTDERQFASTAAHVIYPLLMAAEEAIAKKGHRRRNAVGARTGETRRRAEDDEEVDPRTHLYIILFVHAYVLDLVRATKGAPGHEIGFADVKPGARESAYAERMLRNVVESYRGLLTQIEDITAEYVSARFVEAYQLVRGEGVVGLETAKPEEELATQTTLTDPIYRYAATVARVAGTLPAARPRTPAEARREFETVLGASLPALIKTARESAKDPVLAPLYLRRMGSLVPPGGALTYLVKGPRVNLYAHLYEAPAASQASLEAFAAGSSRSPLKRGGARAPPGRASAKSETAKHPPPAKKASSPSAACSAEHACFFEAYRLFVTYTKKVVSAEAYAAYLRELDAYRPREAGLLAARALKAQLPFYDFGHRRTQQYEPTDAAITSLYDENGAPHAWTAFVYGGASTGQPETVIEGGARAVARARETGTLKPDAALSDMQCGTCRVRASGTGRLDARKTAASVRAREGVASFYAFYEARCPVGDLHEFKKGPCSKCGLEPAVLALPAAHPARARAYYEKHAAAFRAATTSARSAPPVGKIRAEGSPSPPESGPAWAPDYTLIVRAAELVGVTPATLEAIGATQGREYVDIVEGRGAPPPPGNRSDPRIYAADADVRLFLADYAGLRNAQGFFKIPPAVTAHLEAAQVPKHEYGQLAALLPELSAPAYRAALARVLKNGTPADALTFAIQSLCDMALTVAGAAKAAPDAPEWLAKLGPAFAKSEIAHILRGHRRLAKPGNFDWSIFETEDEEMQDQVSDVGEDVMEEMLATEREEAPEDPFSGDHIDYDTSENNPNNESP
jgi:hypothetical protein